MTPLGAYPRRRLCGQAGMTPRRRSTRTTSSIVPKLMLIFLLRQSGQAMSNAIGNLYGSVHCAHRCVAEIEIIAIGIAPALATLALPWPV